MGRRSVGILLLALLGYSSDCVADPPPAPEIAQLKEPPSRLPRALSSVHSEGPLTLEEVLRNVEGLHPRIRAAIARRERAEADRLTNAGAFDPRLSGEGKVYTLGYYELRNFDAELRQPTTIWGAELYGGYRIGLGVDGDRRYPTYLANETLDGGEVRAGLDVPVFRGGPTDLPRTRLAQSNRLLVAAAHGVEQEKLSQKLAASRAYYRWVLAGQRFVFAQELLDLARKREIQLEERRRAGATADFDVVDNRRMVVERSERLIAGRRELEQAALELSLYLRDDRGKPVVPSPGRFPRQLGPAHHGVLDEGSAVRRVAGCHPTILALEEELAALGSERDFAENQVAPDMRISAQVSRDLGDPAVNPTLAGTNLAAGVKFTMPLLLRSDRGRLGAARATYSQKKADLDWAQDQLTMTVRDSASRLRAAEERVVLNKELLTISLKLAEGERERFGVGEGNLMFVNLREQAVMDAEVRLADAEAVAQALSYEWQLLVNVNCSG